MITEQETSFPNYGDADCIYIIQDDSMIGARIASGDMLIVRQQLDVESGDIALALYNNEVRIGIYSRHKDCEILTPANAGYQSILSRFDRPSFEIIGKAIAFVSALSHNAEAAGT